MNVLILAGDGSLGGLPLHCGNLAQGLQEFKGSKVIIGINKGKGSEFLSKSCKVIIFDFGTNNPLTWLRMYLKLGRIIKEDDINIIHSQNRIPSLYAAIYCFFNRRVKYIWANHLVPIPSNLKHRILTRYGYCAVAEGIAGKEHLINSLRIPENKVRVVNLGIDLRKFTQTSITEQEILKSNYDIKNNDKVILLYGSLHPNKGHLFLLKAISKVGNFNYKIVFPGISNQEYKNLLMENINKLGIMDKIIFPGFIDGRDWLSITDLMVLPSKTEGFPQACVEAFAMGIPVIRTKTGGYEDTKDMCFGVEYGDVESLSSLLMDFFERTSIFSEKASYAKEHAFRYSIEQMVNDYYKIYEEALKS